MSAMRTQRWFDRDPAQPEQLLLAPAEDKTVAASRAKQLFV
jgi:hypothetical protein